MSRKDELRAISFDDLVLFHSDIGTHHDRRYGLRDVFGYYDLSEMQFTRLAKKIKAAYEGKDVPGHRGWPAQREALRWFIEKGIDGIYQIDGNIRVLRRSGHTYYLDDGNHRSFALYVLGADGIRAFVDRW